MKQYFEYNHSSDAVFNDIVDAALELAHTTYEATDGKKPSDYAEKNSLLLKNIGKYCVSNTRYEAEYGEDNLAMFKNPNVNKNAMVRENFDAVLVQIINPLIPEVVND